MKTTALVVISLLVGIVIGLLIYDSQIYRSYEDGSFIGCWTGAPCND